MLSLTIILLGINIFIFQIRKSKLGKRKWLTQSLWAWEKSHQNHSMASLVKGDDRCLLLLHQGLHREDPTSAPQDSVAFFWNRKDNSVLRVEVAFKKSGDPKCELPTLQIFKGLVLWAASGPSVAKPTHGTSQTLQFSSPLCFTPPECEVG